MMHTQLYRRYRARDTDGAQPTTVIAHGTVDDVKLLYGRCCARDSDDAQRTTVVAHGIIDDAQATIPLKSRTGLR